MSKRVEGADGKLSKVIRINAPHEVGRKSLGQDEIARRTTGPVSKSAACLRQLLRFAAHSKE
jgi:hypothetical protein